MRVRSILAGVLVAFSSLSGAAQDYRPKLAVPESMQPFLKHLEPGDDGFPLEARAKELESRLEELSKALRGNPGRLGGATKALLDPGFRGARLLPADGSAQGQAALDVQRAKDLPQAARPRRDAIWRGTAAARPGSARGDRRGVPHHRHRR